MREDEEAEGGDEAEFGEGTDGERGDSGGCSRGDADEVDCGDSVIGAGAHATTTSSVLAVGKESDPTLGTELGAAAAVVTTDTLAAGLAPAEEHSTGIEDITTRDACTEGAAELTALRVATTAVAAGAVATTATAAGAATVAVALAGAFEAATTATAAGAATVAVALAGAVDAVTEMALAETSAGAAETRTLEA